MNAFSPLDRSSEAQRETSIVQQPDHAHFFTSTNLVGSASGTLFLAVLVSVWVAVVFFYVGVKAGRRQVRYHDRPVAQRQHIQTLERIWQLSAKHKD